MEWERHTSEQNTSILTYQFSAVISVSPEGYGSTWEGSLIQSWGQGNPSYRRWHLSWDLKDEWRFTEERRFTGEMCFKSETGRTRFKFRRIPLAGHGVESVLPSTAHAYWLPVLPEHLGSGGSGCASSENLGEREASFLTLIYMLWGLNKIIHAKNLAPCLFHSLCTIDGNRHHHHHHCWSF